VNRRCRYELANGGEVNESSIPQLLADAIKEEIDVIATKNLYEFDGKRGYALGQGQ